MVRLALQNERGKTEVFVALTDPFPAARPASAAEGVDTKEQVVSGVPGFTDVLDALTHEGSITPPVPEVTRPADLTTPDNLPLPLIQAEPELPAKAAAPSGQGPLLTADEIVAAPTLRPDSPRGTGPVEREGAVIRAGAATDPQSALRPRPAAPADVPATGGSQSALPDRPLGDETSRPALPTGPTAAGINRPSLPRDPGTADVVRPLLVSADPARAGEPRAEPRARILNLPDAPVAAPALPAAGDRAAAPAPDPLRQPPVADALSPDPASRAVAERPDDRVMGVSERPGLLRRGPEPLPDRGAPASAATVRIPMPETAVSGAPPTPRTGDAGPQPRLQGRPAPDAGPTVPVLGDPPIRPAQLRAEARVATAETAPFDPGRSIAAERAQWRSTPVPTIKGPVPPRLQAPDSAPPLRPDTRPLPAAQRSVPVPDVAEPIPAAAVSPRIALGNGPIPREAGGPVAPPTQREAWRPAPASTDGANPLPAAATVPPPAEPAASEPARPPEIRQTDSAPSDPGRPPAAPRPDTPAPVLVAAPLSYSSAFRNAEPSVDTGHRLGVEGLLPSLPDGWDPRTASPSGAAGTTSPASGAETARGPALQIAETLRLGPGTFDVTLHPEELGRLTVTVTAEDGKLTVLIAADRADTLDLLRRNADLLSTEAARSGFTDLDLSFSEHRQPPGDQSPAPADSQGSDAPEALAAGWPAAPLPGTATHMVPAAAGLDLRL